MHGGTQCGKAVWHSVVGIKVSIPGAMSGKGTLGTKRWLNVSVYLQVRLISRSVSSSHLLIRKEKFETKDIAWARDGKGLILLGKDQFCCAFEVQEEGDHNVSQS